MSEYQHIGIDIAKDKCDAFSQACSKPLCFTFPNARPGFNTFLKWLQKHFSHPWVAMEATGSYSEPLAEFLAQNNIRVSVINPLQIKHFAKVMLARNKNDRIDAQLISIYGEKMQPRVFSPRPKEKKEIRELTQLIDTLKTQKIQLSNQMHSLQTNEAKKQIKKIISCIERQCEKLMIKISILIDKQAALKKNVALLTSIVGIGKTTAYRIIGCIPDLEQFSSVKQFAAFIGVTPKQHESGKMKGKTTMTKMGHAQLKKSLYMPALVAKQSMLLRPFVNRLEQNGLKPKAIVGAVMRKLSHIIFGVLKSGQTFNPELACAA